LQFHIGGYPMRMSSVWWAVLALALIGAGVPAAGAEKAKKAEAPAAKAEKKELPSELMLMKLSVLSEAEPESGPPPLKVQFKGDVWEGDEPVKPKYQWVFGDGSQSQEKNPSHTYKKPGR